ncbi:MAG: acyl-CoA synthetase [Alphaproteobacteria bacterium]|nr:acyl-CoA synthetase [Alphaproteobacteria bacterium]
MTSETGNGNGIAPTMFDRDLDRGPANFRPLTPIDFLRRAAEAFPERVAVVHGPLRFTYADLAARCRRLASALRKRGIGRGDTVAVMAPNVPALLEAHYGVPMAGAVLNAINVRLDAATIAFILDHAEARIVIVDRAFGKVMADALARCSARPLVIDIDERHPAPGEALAPRIGRMDYETFLADGDPAGPWGGPADEWDAIALNYTSGTTGNPKGVVYHHRGAFLNALGNVAAYQLPRHLAYLWTLPMFHCNGWCFTWAVTAAAGTHVCLRRVDPSLIYPLIAEHGVTLICGAPIVLNLLIHAPDDQRRSFSQTCRVLTGGAAPPSAVIAAMERLGFAVTHAYGLTETYGPAITCFPQADWDGLDLDGRAARMARQGLGNPTVADVRVVDAATDRDVPADGATIGEILLRGSTVMKGYLKNPKATADAFRDGWFRTGDLAVRHPDGVVEVKDRSKDIIISGGENISSLEVEEALYKHPKVMEAAVVARPDAHWGESPCAFVTPKPGVEPPSADDVIAWCRDRLARFKVPRTVVFGPLPKTSTGKIQKFVLRDRAKALGESR